MKKRARLPIVLVLATLALLAVSPTPEGYDCYGNAIYLDTPSMTYAGYGRGVWDTVPDPIELKIWESEYIVRAQLRSIAASTEKVGDEYRPVLRHNFTVHEWMKGDGPSSIVVILRPASQPHQQDWWREAWTWHESAAAAQQHADDWVLGRNTRWEGHHAILLLSKETAGWYYEWHNMSEVPDAQPDTFVFATVQSRHRPNLDFSIESRHRVWLPAEGAFAGESTRFLTDLYVWTTLAEFRALLASLADAPASSVEGYTKCYQQRLYSMNPSAWPDNNKPVEC